MNLKQITDKNPEALKNRAVLKAMINDAFPEERKGLVNAVVTVLDCGIAAKMKGGASQADIGRYTDILCDDYAYVKEVAEESIRLWCEVFSIKVSVSQGNTGTENIKQNSVKTDNNEVAASDNNAEECMLLTQEEEYDDSYMEELFSKYLPPVNSAISCYVLCNVLPPNDEHDRYTFRDIIGCVSTFDDAIAITKKRLNFMTAIHEIKNGAVSKTTIYFTDSSGLVGKRH